MRPLVEEALSQVRGFLTGIDYRYHRGGVERPPDFADLLTLVDRAIGSLIKATPSHDAGAYARCSFCGRYTSSAFIYTEVVSVRERGACDCGVPGGWSGSFEPPGPDSKWSIGRGK